ncbi:F0F1 ATP synthase subunit A [Mycoplasmopsis felis]|uniref:F0F1 ATP synthase subunit A n=1 Tax=Mycoplasmopsis felis TaxID=33923 RepID=UPI0021DF5F0B|nr:F0F1 ATP synthase subunit A [Mycoplasmopsis felis]MCU9936989.1 F0F1 ATP synthase subunit A [Mycoplasmopsis felis]
MEEIKNILFIFDLPQMISLVVTILIILTLSIIIFIKVKKVKKDKAPSGIVLIAEGYVGYIDRTFDEVTSHRLPSARFYIFTLATFLLVGNLTPILGFEPIGTAFSVPLTLAISTWMGVFIAGLIHKKLKYIKEILIKPMDWISKFSPLISLSARMYGNLIGGSTILVMIYGLSRIWINASIKFVSISIYIYFRCYFNSVITFLFWCIWSNFTNFSIHIINSSLLKFRIWKWSKNSIKKYLNKDYLKNLVKEKSNLYIRRKYVINN